MKFRLLRLAYFILISLNLEQYQNYVGPNYKEILPNRSRPEEVNIFTELYNSLYLEQQHLIHL